MTRALEQMDPLLGDWASSSEKYSEGRGHLKVAPTEGGKFLRVESSMEDERFPHGTQLIGSDDSSDECTVLYYDSRGVHRVYRTTFVNGQWKMWRDAPGFNQRYTGTISADGNSIAGQWELSKDGKSWEVDFDLSYTRVGP